MKLYTTNTVSNDSEIFLCLMINLTLKLSLGADFTAFLFECNDFQTEAF